MRIAYFDCFAGASGDMIVGALLDAGVEIDQLQAALASLNVEGYGLSAEPVVKQNFAATKFTVLSLRTGQAVDHTEDHGHADADRHQHGGHAHSHHHHGPHRHLADIRGIIENSSLSDTVKQRATSVFTRLGEAEAKAHGIAIDKVHFHEVGAVDAIVDVVGACVCLELLEIDRVVCSALPPGSGTVHCAHGEMPVPTPATAELLRGVPLAPNRNSGELLTPTGAAILTTLADEYADAPPAGAAIESVGIGAGTRDGDRVPNLLRAIIATAEGDLAAGDTVVLMETNVDDMDGQSIGHCFDLLLTAGALDVWATPIVMKKNRPAWKLSVLSPDNSELETLLADVLFRHTSTFGLRTQRLPRRTLDRRHEQVQTEFGRISVKIGSLNGELTQAQPEYEDCRRAAEKASVSLETVRRAAMAAWRANQS